ncbi:MAG: NRDE family protein [bacterium]
MCLILFANQVHPDYPLVLAANRDEFYDRPTAQLAQWDDQPDLFAGRDLHAGGTWLGLTRSRRLAAVTNYREPGVHRSGAPSRGELVTDFLTGRAGASEHLQELAGRAAGYNGFNLLLGEGQDLYYFSNREPVDGVVTTPLAPGLYGLSNHLLDTPWPKVRRGKESMAALLDGTDEPLPTPFLELLGDGELAPDDELPDTGVGLDWERRLSPMFIESPDYGTRCSTVILRERRGLVTIAERSFNPDHNCTLSDIWITV